MPVQLLDRSADASLVFAFIFGQLCAIHASPPAGPQPALGGHALPAARAPAGGGHEAPGAQHYSHSIVSHFICKLLTVMPIHTCGDRCQLCRAAWCLALMTAAPSPSWQSGYGTFRLLCRHVHCYFTAWVSLCNTLVRLCCAGVMTAEPMRATGLVLATVKQGTCLTRSGMLCAARRRRRGRPDGRAASS